MIKRLRRELGGIKGQKHKHFDEFQKLIKRIAKNYASLFPKFTENVTGSHYVYNFGVPDLFPFTVVKEHGGRDCQSPKAANRVIHAIEDVLDFIEANIPDDEASISEGDTANERTIDIEEDPRILPEPKIPDGDR
jgi:hypothetical protein